MPKFDPRSLNDDEQIVFQELPPRAKSKWPATRVLGWVIAIGGLSVVLNIVSVIVVYGLMVRIESKISTNDTQLGARFTDVEQWVTRERAIRKKQAADPYWSDEAIKKRRDDSNADIAKAESELKALRESTDQAPVTGDGPLPTKLRAEQQHLATLQKQVEKDQEDLAKWRELQDQIKQREMAGSDSK
jgi:uncharacterized protein YlxW (UPF0749 family)